MQQKRLPYVKKTAENVYFVCAFPNYTNITRSCTLRFRQRVYLDDAGFLHFLVSQGTQ